MSLKYAMGELIFNDSLILTPKTTKDELMSIPGFVWESWPDNIEDTVYTEVFFRLKTIIVAIFIWLSVFLSPGTQML